jgi:hypothetical protein
LGAGAVALIASAGLTLASPALAQMPGGAGATGSAQVAPAQRGNRGGPQLPVVAKALGLTEAELQTELRAGKTIADVAKAKGIELSVVSAALLDAEKANLAQAVANGRLTQAQADARLADAQTHITDMFNGKMPHGPGGRGSFDGGRGGRGGRGGSRGGMAGGPQLIIIAKALGIEETALKTELQAGKTIADVAKAKSVDLTVVSNALLEAEKTNLAQAVKDGRLTQAQADERLANAQTHITGMLNGKMPQGPGRPRRPGGHGMKPGATPAPPATTSDATGATL